MRPQAVPIDGHRGQLIRWHQVQLHEIAVDAETRLAFRIVQGVVVVAGRYRSGSCVDERYDVDVLRRPTLQEFDLNLPDGLPGVWVGKYLKNASRMEQIRGADFFRALVTRSAAVPIRHYLCGGKPEVADRLRSVCRERFSNDQIVGTYCPPFRALDDAEWATLAADIAASRPDIVWIGLSTPKQEVFARELARRVDVHYIATIGAAFDFHIGEVREAPLFVQRSGFEWFYRMCLDPKRLVRRYAEVVPLFLLYNLLDVARKGVQP